MTRGAERVFSDAELSASLRAIGPLLPAISYGGRLLDGRRRARLCAELGQELRIVECRTREQAAAALWAVHPERAVAEFPVGSAREGARLFQTRAAAVAVYLGNPHERTSYHDNAGKLRTYYKPTVRKCLRYVERCEQGIEPFTMEGVRRALEK